MTNMQNIDVDKVISVARNMAKKHNMCGVVDDALKEAGLLKSMSGMLKVEVPVEDFVDTVAFGGGDLSVRIYRGTTMVTSQVLDKDSVTLVPFTAEQEATLKQEKASKNWLYSSEQGRVLHYFADPTRGYAAKCGQYPWDRPLRTVPKGENRRCAKCAASIAS